MGAQDATKHTIMETKNMRIIEEYVPFDRTWGVSLLDANKIKRISIRIGIAIETTKVLSLISGRPLGQRTASANRPS